VVDYRKFLARKQTLVLPYFGGASVDAPERRLRLASEVEPGWWTFEVEGRIARAMEPAEPGDLSALPRARGYLWGDRLVRNGATAEPISFLPAEEPPLFAPALGRRWHGGELIFEQLELESEVVEGVRRALEEDRPLALVKGVPAELRSAFALALVQSVSRRVRIPAAAAELKDFLVEIAEGGAPAAEAALRALEAERIRYRREAAERERRMQELAVRQAVEQERERRRADAEIAGRVRYATEEERRRALRQTARDRIEDAVDAAGARLVRTRGLEADRMEVTWTFMAERFVSIVDGVTLQVIDSGICLGHPAQDQLLTLDSLPGVVREAITTGRLVILRHDEGWD
jgi:hypothetical protein